MSDSVVSTQQFDKAAESLKIRMVLAFFAIYILWGTTFLAIRVAVEELPRSSLPAHASSPPASSFMPSCDSKVKPRRPQNSGEA